MNNRAALGVAATFLASVSAPVAAHHSYINSPFDACQKRSIEGTLQEAMWNGPHVWLTVKVDDATIYRVEWTGPAQLANQGVEAADLPIGARIAVTGSPHTSDHALSLLTEVRAVAGELNWSRQFTMAASQCSAAPPRGA
jgi:hypothetical protein